jgi:predicted KAP-like P-loop ATPase
MLKGELYKVRSRSKATMSWISRILNPSRPESGTAATGQTGADATSCDKHAALIPTDNPIRREQDDALGRARVAKSFAQQILSIDPAEGIVVGVLGPWGSGKTSFVNLTRVHLDKLGVAVLDFNPWMFSGAEQLVESFFFAVC